MSHYNIYQKPAVNPHGAWANASFELTWAIEEVTPRDDLIVKLSPDAAFDDSAYDQDGNLIVYTKEMINELIKQLRATLPVMGTPSAEIRAEIEKLKDLIGKPVAHQHAAITFLEIGVVEINPELLPDDIGDMEDFHPLSKQDRKRYPVLWGAVIHEAAHANHSNWVIEANKRIRERKITAEERNWLGAAMILEESRIEKYQIDERPQDQVWLEAAGMHVAVEEYAEACKAVAKLRAEDPNADEAQLSRYTCGRAAALALARVDSGSIFWNKKIDSIELIVRAAFGDKDYDELQEIWRAAQACGDDDMETMLELGHRWYDLTKDAGDDQQPMGIPLDMDGDPNGSDSDQDGLGKALGDAAEQSQKEASGKAEEEERQRRIDKLRNAARTEANQQRQAQAQAQKVFGSSAGAPTGYGHPVTGYRKPTLAEINLARVTRRKLQAVYVPEKVATRVPRELPPGRLSTRALQQRNAQRQAGMIPSAEPFTYTERKHVTTPALKVGIIQDVSGSQSAAAAAAVSGAWSLAKAANEIVDAKVAMVSFGNDVHSIIKPLTKVVKVPELNTNAGTNYFLDALKAIEGELELTKPGAARLLVILTDGEFNFTDENGRDAALKRLTEAGVKVLWMDTDGYGRHLPRKMPGLHIFNKASGNYSAIPSVICHEAVTAIKR